MKETTLRADASARYHARWMVRRDLAEVCALTRVKPSGMEAVLRRRDQIGFVVEQGDTVVAACVYRLCKDRLVLLRLDWAPGHEAAAAQMLNKLKDKLGQHRRSRLTYSVREEGLALQLFLRSQGFVAARTGRGRIQFVFREGWPC